MGPDQGKWVWTSERERESWGNFLGDPVVKTLCSQCRGHGFNLWSGNWIPQATIKSLHALTKDSTCRNENQRSHVLQLRPGTVKYININKSKYYIKKSVEGHGSEGRGS